MSAAPTETGAPWAAPRRTVRLLGERVSGRIGTRTPWVGAGLLLLVGVAATAGLLTGNGDIAPGTTLRIVAGDYSGVTAFEVLAVLDIRLPRVLCAVLAGWAFGVSGAMFQALTDNPLGSPDVIGFTSGAATGAVVALLVAASWVSSAMLGALLGGLLTAVAVYWLSWRGGVAGYRLILVGIGVTAVLGSVRAFLISRAELGEAAAAYRWLVGSLSGRSWDDIGPLLLGTVVLVPLTLACLRPLERIGAGADLARALGLALEPNRALIMVVGTAWCAVAVAAAGPVGFVAMAAPQLVRRITRAPGPHVVTAGLFGALLLVLADLLGMWVVRPAQLPAGIATAVLGGLYLIWLLNRERRAL
ncbi:iron chelate uptake ABC transporter family permease subunit [Pseudonocardia sp. NPDC049635]|uniref:FecCD family ABC transporter permease n=1 Tax=Pseudonocardia sp. NPDC049635 TaxID=3155506 RepID=UPI003402BEAD